MMETARIIAVFRDGHTDSLTFALPPAPLGGTLSFWWESDAPQGGVCWRVTFGDYLPLSPVYSYSVGPGVPIRVTVEEALTRTASSVTIQRDSLSDMDTLEGDVRICDDVRFDAKQEELTQGEILRIIRDIWGGE
jgi:hypothetical protein